MVSGIGGAGGGGKIGGPKAPAPAPPTSTESTKGAAFGASVTRTEHAAPAGAATPLDRLRKGEIDLHRYAEIRVQEATAHLDGVLPAGDIEKIRADLHELIESDPDVAALVKAAEIGS